MTCIMPWRTRPSQVRRVIPAEMAITSADGTPNPRQTASRLSRILPSIRTTRITVLSAWPSALRRQPPSRPPFRSLWSRRLGRSRPSVKRFLVEAFTPKRLADRLWLARVRSLLGGSPLLIAIGIWHLANCFAVRGSDFFLCTTFLRNLCALLSACFSGVVCRDLISSKTREFARFYFD